MAPRYLRTGFRGTNVELRNDSFEAYWVALAKRRALMIQKGRDWKRKLLCRAELKIMKIAISSINLNMLAAAAILRRLSPALHRNQVWH
jgi:hypothetical protein